MLGIAGAVALGVTTIVAPINTVPDGAFASNADCDETTSSESEIDGDDGVKYKVITFEGTCDWTVPNGLSSAEVLVVAGGGGGGAGVKDGTFSYSGGGGGAGGVLHAESLEVDDYVSGEKISIVVGEGGTGGSSGSTGTAANGGDSAFGSATATGGGGGANADPDESLLPGADGGSGGGGSASGSGGSSSQNAPNSSWLKYGNSGGKGSGYLSGGGGGAGGAGGDGSFPDGAGEAGPAWPSSITGDSVNYAEGGAGATGGQSSNQPDDRLGDPGENGRGDGGGGGVGAGGGGDGGDGVVIVRYALNPGVPTDVAGSVGTNSITFSWGAPENPGMGVTGYEYRTDEGNWNLLDADARSVEVDVGNVCDDLDFEVRAVGGEYTGAASKLITVSGCNTVSIVAGGGASVGSDWTIVSGVITATQDVSIDASVVEDESHNGDLVEISAENVVIESAIDISHDLTITSQVLIDVRAALTATNSTIIFQGAAADDNSGTLETTSGGSITADKLLVQNIHDTILDDVSVNTFAAVGGHRVSLINGQALEVGTVADADGSDVHGVSANGPVSIDTTTGDLSITQPVGTSDNSPDFGVRLRAGTATDFGDPSGGSVTVSGSGSFDVPHATTNIFSGSAENSSGLTELADTEVVSEEAPTVAAGEVGVAYRAGPPVFSSAATMDFDETLTLAADDPAGGSVSYSEAEVNSSDPCTISDGVITPTGIGNCDVRATAAGGATSVTTIVISKAAQSIAFTSTVPTDAVSGTTYTPTATATSDLDVEFSITEGSDSVCTLSDDGVVTFLTAGTCTVEATIEDGQTEAENYLAATAVSQTIVAELIDQSITFATPEDREFGDPSFTLDAVVDTSRAVTYSASDSSSSVCRVDGGTGEVNILDVGDCTITASSAGDASYAAAPDVTRTFSVQAVVPTVTSLTSTAFGDGEVTVEFTPPESDGGADITGYRAVATPTAGGGTTQQTCVTVSPCTVTGLENGDEYTVTLAAINSAGTGPASDASAAVTPAAAPDAVSQLRTTPGDEQLLVEWSQGESLGGGVFLRYEVYLRESGEVTWPDTATENVTSITTVKVTLTGLTNGTEYDVNVVTITEANGEEVESAAVASGVPVTVPGAPTDFTVTALSSTTALASWKAPADNGGTAITSYTVSPDCTFASDTDVSCTLTGLTPSSSVTVLVRATNAVGTGSTVDAVVVMPDIPRIAPEPSPRPELANGPRQFPSGPLTTPRGFVGGEPATLRTTPTADGGFDVSISTLRLGVRPGVTPGGGASSLGGAALPGATPGENAGSPTEGTRLPVPQGGSTAFRGAGLLPGSALQVFLPGSSGSAGGAELARIAVNASGEFDGEVDFGRNPGQMPMPIGQHVVQAIGYDENGEQVVVELPVNISQADPSPEWDREAGGLPGLAPGEMLATSAGLPESVVITALPEIGQVNAVSDTWRFSVRVAGDAGSVEQAGVSANVSLIQERGAEVSGSGFQPGTRVDVWLFSEPTLLGSATVGHDGEFDSDFYLDPRFATLGDHTLQLQGVGTDGFVKAVNLGVSIDRAATETSEGANTLMWWALGVFLAMVIALVLFALLSRRSQRA